MMLHKRFNTWYGKWLGRKCSWLAAQNSITQYKLKSLSRVPQAMSAVFQFSLLQQFVWLNFLPWEVNASSPLHGFVVLKGIPKCFQFRHFYITINVILISAANSWRGWVSERRNWSKIWLNVFLKNKYVFSNCCRMISFQQKSQYKEHPNFHKFSGSLSLASSQSSLGDGFLIDKRCRAMCGSELVGRLMWKNSIVWEGWNTKMFSHMCRSSHIHWLCEIGCK